MEERSNLLKLLAPFPESDIEWRVQSCGEKNNKIWAKVIAYVTNRAIQTRLDEVCGQEYWKNEFIKAPEGGILCGISIKVNNEWVTKYDGAENTEIESIKGGLSNSMKRAAVQWGIGRYLYNLDVSFAIISEQGVFSAKTKEGKWFKWNPPALPNWALPENEESSKSYFNSQAANPEKLEAKEVLQQKIKDKIASMPDLVAEYFTKQNMTLEEQYNFCKDRKGDVDRICTDIQAFNVGEQFKQSELWEQGEANET